ncbi:N-6 DNA methylase [Microbacterium sp. JZ101]
MTSGERLVKSRQRVSDHGEVFTPRWLVDDMLDLVKDETERIDSRFLEPACGSGNFLVPVLERKLAAVQVRHGRSDFENRHYALFALMCIYGIELLADNAQECRENLAGTFTRYLKLGADDQVWLRAAQAVLAANIVQGDALKLTDARGEHIVFPEWGYLGRGKYQRRDFRFDSLARKAAFDGLFAAFEEHDVFAPVKSYPAMTAQEIAA